MRILAIDPGNTESGYAVIDSTTYRPIAIGKKENHVLHEMITSGQFDNVDYVSIEMIGHYGKGMPAGKTVFDTCIWIGRFLELFARSRVKLVLRATVKAHICGSTAAKDSNISQALIDRFAPAVRNRGKGTVADPGWFFGFRADIWQAYALAVMTADTLGAMSAVVHRPAQVHLPFDDDGVTYCGWDLHDGCGEVWPCSTVRAQGLTMTEAVS